MTVFKPIQTKDAPEAIGCYSQAVSADSLIFLSGQIGIDPSTQQLVDGFENQLRQVFENLQQVLAAAGANFSHILKLNVYLIDLSHFSLVNDVMQQLFKEPYPARAAVEVRGLPRGALVEIDGIAKLSSQTLSA